jgi:hypothetical protein
MNQELPNVTIRDDNFGGRPRRQHHSPLGDDDAGVRTKEMKKTADESNRHWPT